MSCKPRALWLYAQLMQSYCSYMGSMGGITWDPHIFLKSHLRQKHFLFVISKVQCTKYLRCYPASTVYLCTNISVNLWRSFRRWEVQWGLCDAFKGQLLAKPPKSQNGWRWKGPPTSYSLTLFLNGSTALWVISASSQFCIICKAAEGALSCIIQVTD